MGSWNYDKEEKSIRDDNQAQEWRNCTIGRCGENGQEWQARKEEQVMSRIPRRASRNMWQRLKRWWQKLRSK